MDATIGSTCSCCHYRPRIRRETIDPFTSRNRLAGRLVNSQRRPVTFVFDLFVGNGSLDDQNERGKLAFGGKMEGVQKALSIFIGEEGIMKIDFGNTRESPEQNVFQTRLGRGRDGDGIPVTPEASRDPENIDLADRPGSGGKGVTFAALILSHSREEQTSQSPRW